MDIKTLLPLVVGAAIGSVATIGATILTLASGWLSKRAENKRSATYLAARLAVVLERFAIECATRIANQELHESSTGRQQGINDEGPLPELLPFPDELNWSSLQPDLIDRVLVIPNECLLANGAIGLCWDLQEDYLPSECMRQCGKVGFMAWTLSADLRTRYGVRAFDPSSAPSGDIMVLLKRYHDEALRLVTQSEVTVLTDGDGSVGRVLKARMAWAKWRLGAR
jgi:hypothetical protein